MRDWKHITPEEILRAFVIERRRQACVPSCAGLDENGRMPSASPVYDWDMLLLLTKRVEPQALDAFELKWCGYRVDERASKQRKAPVAESEWREHEELPTGWNVEEYAAAKALDEDPPNMITVFAGEFPFLLGPREIGRHLGITATEAKRLMADGSTAVAENLAKLKESK